MTQLTPLEPRILLWIADLGWGSGWPAERQLSRISAVDVLALAGTADQVAALLGRSLSEIWSTPPALAAAWSAPAPAAHLATLAAAVDDAQAKAAEIARRLMTCANGITAIADELNRLIAWANSAVEWQSTAISRDSPIGIRRTAVAREVHVGLLSAAARAAAIIAPLSALTGLDPSAGLRGLNQAGDSGALPGSTPAVPTDTATTAVDAAARARLSADLNSDDPSRRAFAAGVLATLSKAAAEGSTARLLMYQPEAFDGQGRFAVSIDDPATADHVAILTPGVSTTVDDLTGTLVSAAAVKAEAEQQAPGETTSVVLWYGYDVPLAPGPPGTPSASLDHQIVDLLAAAGSDRATEAGELLARDVATLKAQLRPAATITLIGHSMGSVVTAEAATHPIGVDAVVLLGSPGVGRSGARVSDLVGVPSSEVFTLSFDQDPVTQSRTDIGTWIVRTMVGNAEGYPRNGFGTDPADPAYGAQLLDVASGYPGRLMTSDVDLPDFRFHAMGNYLSGASAAAVGAIVAGRTAQLKRRQGR